MNNKDILEVWGYKTYRPFRIYWILHEYELSYKSIKIGSRTGETQTKKYLKMNPKGKIPILKHKNIIINESVAAVNYITYNFKKPKSFFIPETAFDRAKVDEWCFFSIMELDCLVIYTLRRHELEENNGLANLYGKAPNAIKTAREHFNRMINSCKNSIPKEGFLLGKNLSVADIIFASSLMHCDRFNLEIKSKNVMKYLERIKKRKQYLDAYYDCFNK